MNDEIEIIKHDVIIKRVLQEISKSKMNLSSLKYHQKLHPKTTYEDKARKKLNESLLNLRFIKTEVDNYLKFIDEELKNE